MILMWNYRMIFKFSDTQKIVKQNLLEACKISETIFFMYEWVSRIKILTWFLLLCCTKYQGNSIFPFRKRERK